ncbi:hypothetical protein RZ760_010455 [Providencia rettgeri]|nr:hypothetical protein [Providencia rettgeri]
MSSQSKSKYEELKEQVKIFLANETAQGMLIHGDWGIGKTHFINTIVNDHKMLVDAKFYFYSYVSLYSTSTVSDFKDEIISNKKMTEKGFFNILKVLWSNFVDNIKINFNKFGISFVWRLKPKLARKLSNTLIIVDDLERKSKSIDIAEALGTLNGMTIENGSKFIVLANISELASDEDKKYLQKNKDKLFSKLMHFNEDIDISISICEALAKKKPTMMNYWNVFNEISRKTNITNVRVLYSILESFSLFNSKLHPKIEKLKINPILEKEINEMYFFLSYLFESGMFIKEIKTSEIITFIKTASRLTIIDDSNDVKDADLKIVCQRIPEIIGLSSKSNLLVHSLIIENILNYIISSLSHDSIIEKIIHDISNINQKVSHQEVYLVIRKTQDNFIELSESDIDIIKKIPDGSKISIKDYILILPYQFYFMPHKDVNEKFSKYIEVLGGVDAITDNQYLDNIDLNNENYKHLNEHCRNIIMRIKNVKYIESNEHEMNVADDEMSIMYRELLNIKYQIVKNNESYLRDDYKDNVLSVRKRFEKCKHINRERAESILLGNDSLLIRNYIYATEVNKLGEINKDYSEFEELYHEVNAHFESLINAKLEQQRYQNVRLNEIKREIEKFQS